MSNRASSRPLKWIVFDLDGVFRHWNDPELDEVEESFGLPPRTILDLAFSADLGPRAITGEINYREWMDLIRAHILEEYGQAVSPALDVWEHNVGVVDWDMIAMLRDFRTRIPVALLSNGTTRLRRDLHVLGITGEFDLIFNTAEIGVAKPDPEVFRIVCRTLDVETAEAAFVDDLEENVAGATAAGMTAHQHTQLGTTQEFLESLL